MCMWGPQPLRVATEECYLGLWFASDFSLAPVSLWGTLCGLLNPDYAAYFPALPGLAPTLFPKNGEMA